MMQQRVDDCLEVLCGKGCRAVWGDIEALEAGDPLPETRDLTSDELRQVVAQLKSVMSVYQGSCVPG